MKKVIALVCTTILLGSTVFGQSFNTVLDWMYWEGLTKYNQVADFRPSDSITRGEAAKFVNQYAQLEGLTKSYTQCNFSDIAGYDYTLVPHIAEACAYGLLKGSNGTFNPNGNITEAQAITVVIRSLYWFLDETGAYRRQPYYEAGKQLGIIQSETLQGTNQVNISRQKLGTWFYIASQQITNADVAGLDGSEDLLSILQDIFGSEVLN